MWHSYKDSEVTSDVSKEESDVSKHEDITQGYGAHVSPALSVYLILNRALHKT